MPEINNKRNDTARSADDWVRANNEVRIDGSMMRYVDCGQGDEVILMLHGYPQNSMTWRHQIQHFSTNARVIAPDLLGWGASDQPTEISYDYNSEVNRIATFLDEIGVNGQVNLFGHDYGGFLALGVADRCPSRLRRLAILNSRSHRTFVGSFYRVSWILDRLASQHWTRNLFRILPLHRAHRSSLQHYIRRGCFDESQLETYLESISGASGRRFLGRFFQGYELAAKPELLDAFARLDCPRAIIWGDRDPYCPYFVAEELAKAATDAKATRIKGASHFVMEERPDEVTNALSELMACG